jgi:hypothetical protein
MKNFHYNNNIINAYEKDENQFYTNFLNEIIYELSLELPQFKQKLIKKAVNVVAKNIEMQEMMREEVSIYYVFSMCWATMVKSGVIRYGYDLMGDIVEKLVVKLDDHWKNILKDAVKNELELNNIKVHWWDYLDEDIF